MLAPSLTGEALYRRYHQTSIYCLPSTGEGFPSTILEAMYFGGAIVAGNSGYVSYQLDDGRCGRLFRPGDIDALTEELTLLISSPEKRLECMKAARERVEMEFVWERHFDQLQAKLLDLMG